MNRDLAHNLKPTKCLSPVAITADVASATTPVDTQGYDSAMAEVSSGAIVAAGLVVPYLQESDTTTDGDFTDVDAADMPVNEFAALIGVGMAAGAVYKASYTGSKRYLRVRFDYVSGTSIVAGANIVLGRPSQCPVGNFPE
jgi:hypothetical protein